jgi:hypothetical protein
MAISNNTTKKSSPTNGRPARIIVLKLSPERLNIYPSDSTPKEDEKDEKLETSLSSPSSTSGEPRPAPSSVDNGSESGSTPAPNGVDDTLNQKDSPRPKAGVKRGATQMSELLKASKNKAGPKKRQKLEDAPVDPGKPLPPGPKLGPKVSQGAINSSSRVLDRSGAPCRRWERKPLQLKSFTGIAWDLPAWRTPNPKNQNPPDDSADSLVENGDSDSKALNGNSAAPSEKSNIGDRDLTPLPTSVVNSPIPIIAMTA